MLFRAPIAFASLLALATLVESAAPPQLDRAGNGPDGDMLRAAGIKTSPTAVLGLFRRFVPTPEEQKRLVAFVKDLGAENFEAREKAVEGLVAAGPGALPYLRHAASSKDPQVAR